jgi:hypothetical protein
MRITRDTLLKIVRDTVAQRTRSDRGVIAIYLSGSLLEDEYLLGGTADIDLFIIHTDPTPAAREIVHLSDEVHLDIAHHQHRDYRQARLLRTHPWIGPNIINCKILYDPQHFMDFTQASVRAQFDRPELVLARARVQVNSARQTWVTFHEQRPDPEPNDILAYLAALENAANGVAGLNGPPLTERRFLQRFARRAEAARKPGLFPGLMGLLGVSKIDLETLQSWFPTWQAAFQAVPTQDAPIRLHPHRQVYYRQGLESLVAGAHPMSALWPLLRTWTLAVSLLPQESDLRLSWRAALQTAGLIGQDFQERVDALDAYLDQVEETLDSWARENGVYTE